MRGGREQAGEHQERRQLGAKDDEPLHRQRSEDAEIPLVRKQRVADEQCHERDEQHRKPDDQHVVAEQCTPVPFRSARAQQDGVFHHERAR